MTPQDALTRVIEHREIFHDEMLSLFRQIMSGEMSPHFQRQRRSFGLFLVNLLFILLLLRLRVLSQKRQGHRERVHREHHKNFLQRVSKTHSLSLESPTRSELRLGNASNLIQLNFTKCN